MKRWMIVLFGLVLAASLVAAPAKVQIKEASLYSKPSAASKFLGRIPLGTTVTILSENEGWAEVKIETQGLRGWLRSQTITTKELKLQSGSEASGVSSTEVSLAGRGFSEEIEKDYRKKNPTLNYALIDQMEALRLSNDELNSFLSDGGIHPAGGQ